MSKKSTSFFLKIPMLFAKVLALLFIVSFSHCASLSEYSEYRRKDLQDSVTIGLETGSYGFGFRLSFLSLGFFFQGKDEDKKGYGLRGGSLGEYHSGQLVYGFLGGENFYAGEVIRDEKGEAILNNNVPLVLYSRDNIKSHKVRYLKFYKDPPSARRKRQREKEQREIIGDIVKSTGDETLLSQLPPEKKKPFGYSPEYLYQVEFFVGIYGGIRVGINFAEVLDFFLGLGTIDLLQDDVRGEVQKEDL